MLELARVRLHAPTRIEGLACCEFIALLCQCLVEREIRRTMAREGIAALPLYHERRAAKAPTAPRVFDLLAERGATGCCAGASWCRSSSPS